jgi:type II secretory pathway component PulK
VDALGDWLDDNEDGAWESDYYRKRKPPYAAANRWLFSWPELLAVRGFDRDQFARKPRYAARAAFQADLVDQVTLVPAERDAPVTVNLNTAGADVLRGVLGINQDPLVGLILVGRARAPWRSVEAVLAMMEPAVRQAVGPYLSVQSRFFRVEVRADSGDQSTRLRVLAFRHSDGHVEVVQWWMGRAAG